METSRVLLDDDDFRRQISDQFPSIKQDTGYVFDKQKLRSCILDATISRSGLQQAMENGKYLDARRKRRHFLFRGAHKAQILATSIINFLDSFSTIVDIVKGIDQRAGGIAYGTLYILFKVHYLFILKRDLQSLKLVRLDITNKHTKTSSLAR